MCTTLYARGVLRNSSSHMRTLSVLLVLGLGLVACGPSDRNGGTCENAENCDMGPCDPGASRSCYTGHPGTENVGPCTGGSQMCLASGTWSNCEGEVVPTSETCGDNVDNNCN